MSAISRGASASRFLLVVLAALTACGREGKLEPDLIQLGSIVIDTPSFAIERGRQVSLRATAKDLAGKPVTVPLVWRSSVDTIATFDAQGRLIARDTGAVAVVATALGIASAPIAVHVVWEGPATVELLPLDPGLAIGPGSRVRDSVRVLVKNRHGAPLSNVKVRFTVTDGGGSVSQADTITGADGRAATVAVLGPVAGPNTYAVAALDDAGVPLTRVSGNPSTVTVTSFDALSIVTGNAQTGQILADLPVVPQVKLVDAQGQPRIGVPVMFTATQGGRVEAITASTDAGGVATPGTWTLGDLPGAQDLVVSVESATLSLNATATGTPIYYMPEKVIAGASATCGVATDLRASCWGAAPQNGSGDTTSLEKPQPTVGNVAFESLRGGLTHFCGVANDKSAYCWGLSAFADTSGVTIHADEPTRLGSAISWLTVAPGGAHNCGLAMDNSAYCWGDGTRGQLGDRGSAVRNKPVAVAGNFTFGSIAAGGEHSCGLTLDGIALCWGGNQSGQLGDGSTSARNDPTLVTGGVKYQAIGAGELFTCGLSVAGIARCWGSLVNSSTPVPIDGVPSFSSISVGGGHACALTSDGTAYCWGANNFGQLGDSTTTSRPSAQPVKTSLRFRSISAGLTHTCGLTVSGSVACWGRNRAGELGDRIVTFRVTPRLVVLGVAP